MLTRAVKRKVLVFLLTAIAVFLIISFPDYRQLSCQKIEPQDDKTLEKFNLKSISFQSNREYDNNDFPGRQGIG